MTSPSPSTSSSPSTQTGRSPVLTVLAVVVALAAGAAAGGYAVWRHQSSLEHFAQRLGLLESTSASGAHSASEAPQTPAGVKLAQPDADGKPVLVACAGCYPTATSLAAAPAVRAGWVAENGPVIVDAISGVTGAGKSCNARTHFCSADENLEAYGVGKHRHTPEIEQILGLTDRIVFTPHLAPLKRGLLSTVTLPLTPQAIDSLALEDVVDYYKQFYAGRTFVRVLDAGQQPKTASVVGTNAAQIGLALNKRAGVLVATGAIDNLCKGAAGQAVQCANIVFGFDERRGLPTVACPV